MYWQDVFSSSCRCRRNFHCSDYSECITDNRCWRPHPPTPSMAPLTTRCHVMLKSVSRWRHERQFWPGLRKRHSDTIIFLCVGEYCDVLLVYMCHATSPSQPLSHHHDNLWLPCHITLSTYGHHATLPWRPTYSHHATSPWWSTVTAPHHHANLYLPYHITLPHHSTVPMTTIQR